MAELDNHFVTHLKYLQTTSEKLAAAAGGAAARPWQLAEGVTEIGSANCLAAGFDRDELNTAYKRLMQTVDAGRVGTLIAIKKQIDDMAAAERALSLQLASGPRLAAFAAARRAAHGLGSTFPNMQREATAFLATANATT